MTQPYGARAVCVYAQLIEQTRGSYQDKNGLEIHIGIENSSQYRPPRYHRKCLIDRVLLLITIYIVCTAECAKPSRKRL